MAKVAVVFHSGYGHTLRMAQSVAAGAGAELVTIDADGNVPDAAWDTLAAADAIIFGSPTYMGSVSWQVQKVCGCFQQALVHPSLERQNFRWLHRQRQREW